MRVVREFPRAVRSIENLWIPLSDGCRLAARVWMPADAETAPVPAILEYLPYRKRDLTRGRDEPMHRYLAGHGYASVRVDLRGSGDSDGVLADEYLPREQEDGVEVIAWLARQPWCSGRVGMTGISWGGFNALQVAARRPPELGAVITLCSTDDRYADDAHYMGGCLLIENLLWGSILLTYNALPPHPEVVGDRWSAMWRERLEQAVLFPELWLRHQRRDAYWRQGSVCEDYDAIACPVYAIGGWADGYSNAVPRLLAGLSVPRKGLVGPWSHDFPHTSRPGPRIGYLQETLRWWDQWLKGVETGIMDEPTYRVWMQDSVPPRTTYEDRPGRWVAEESWPSPRIGIRVRPLARMRGPDAPVRFRSPLVTGLAGGDWCAFGSDGELPGDQREDDGRSVVFDSEPLSGRLEVLGAPRVVLEIASDRPVAQVAVRLNEVRDGGASLRVTYGLLNLTHREGHGRPKPLEPGRRYRVAVPMNDVAHAFAPGSRLRVAVSSSYWPIAWPSPEPAVLTLDPGGSRLELPVRPARVGDETLASFGEPEAAPGPDHVALRAARYRRTVERDLVDGRTVFREVSAGSGFDGVGLARIEEIGLEVGHALEREHRVHPRDPSGAAASVRQEIRLRRPGWDVHVESRVGLTCDPGSFRFDADLLVTLDGRELFARRWSPSVPRDLL